MIVEEIELAKNSMDYVRDDFNRLNRLYDELFVVNLEERVLNNTKKTKRFFIHAFPLFIILRVLSVVLLVFGRLGNLIFGLLFLASFIISIYYTIRFDLSPYYRYKIEKIQSVKFPLEEEIQDLASHVENHLTTDDRMDIIPTKYRYPDAVDFFYDVITVGRANSMKEAMNLYEDHLHKWRLENKNEEILELQRQTLEETISAKRASSMAAAFSMAAFFSKD